MHYGIAFDFAGNIMEAAEKIKDQEYTCIVVKADGCSWEGIAHLRKLKPISTILLPPECSQVRAYDYTCISTIMEDSKANGKEEDFRHSYLDSFLKQGTELTVISIKDLRFCLEYRSVEIRGSEIELTEKEFDILALLLMNPRIVFTYEMIIDAVWREDPAFYSSKAIATHISNIRRKLKVAPDTPEFIKSVRGVGYKFEIPK